MSLMVKRMKNELKKNTLCLKNTLNVINRGEQKMQTQKRIFINIIYIYRFKTHGSTLATIFSFNVELYYII